jgi:hypothetical protein
MRVFSKFIVGLGVAIAAAASSPAIAAPLTASEVEEALIGKTIQGKRMGMTIKIKLEGNGSAAMESTIMDDTGNWRMNGQELCMKWQSFNNGEERCSLITREKDGYRLEGGPLMKVLPDS